MVMFEKHSRLPVLLLLIFFHRASATALGKCPRLKYMPNFNMTRFAGRWYEIERSFYFVQLVSSCVSVDLIENGKGQLEVDVVTKSRWSGTTLIVSEGVASPLKRDPSVFLYKVGTRLPRFMGRYLPGAGVYQVIDTDYDDYAVLWSCTNYGFAHTDLIWIWGRQLEISEERRVQVYEMLDDMKLDSERLILPKNDNCSEY